MDGDLVEVNGVVADAHDVIDLAVEGRSALAAIQRHLPAALILLRNTRMLTFFAGRLA